MFREPVDIAMMHAGHILLWSALALAVSTILIAVIDIPFQIFEHTRKLRMSFQEIKDDFKETEGKPEVKSRIRRVQQEMAQRRMLQDVPQADVVITNPDHFSIALSYDPIHMGAPLLLAKGVDEIALKIREIAQKHEVPILRLPPLARSLYYHGKVGEEIPEGLYIAIAQILAYIYQMDQYQSGKGEKPRGLPPLPIPDDLKVDENGRQI
jgi:flagellar biosynthetic protein FlhB